MLCVQRKWPGEQFSIDDDVGLEKLFVQNNFQFAMMLVLKSCLCKINFQLTMMLVLTGGSNSAPSPGAGPSQSTLSLWI